MRPTVLCIIPARGGSKTIPRKNLVLLGNKPLVAYSISHGLESSRVSRTIVSTDDAEIASVAKSYGAEVPFLRPSAIAGDTSSDLETFQHALDWLSENENYVPDICLHLRPTCPIRNVEDIDKILETLTDDVELDAVRSIVRAPDTPFKMWFRGSDGLLTAVVASSIKEAYNLPRQVLPEVFLQNAAIDAVRTSVILNGSMTGTRIYGYVTETFFDIDTEMDLAKARDFIEGLKK